MRRIDRSARTAALLAPAFAVAILALAPAAFAADPAARGLAVATEADTRDQGFKDSVVTLRMTLRNRQGDSSVRELRTRALEVANDGDKSLITFDTPADVKGTALLSFTHKSGPDDQWLFLPALKRVKRIASDNKAGPFMGSEFAYEDLGSQELDKYKHKLVGQEVLAGRKSWKIERKPVDARSGYSKQVQWIDQEYMAPIKVEYFDRKGELLKTATFTKYQKYGKWFRADALTMVNHQTKKESHLTWTNHKLSEPLKSKDFESDALGE